MWLPILDYKKKIQTWTGIQTSDLQISSLEVEIRIPVHVQIFLLNSKTVISQGTNYVFLYLSIRFKTSFVFLYLYLF